MPDKKITIDWESVWNSTLKNKELFPIKSVNKKTVSLSCPTRFSSPGVFSIDITPEFNKSSINLEMLIFNDNLSIKDLGKSDKSDKDGYDFNRLSSKLVDYELSNRIMDRFTIKSNGFSSAKEAEEALVDYLNNKATESGRMFDDKLDELNDSLQSKDEGYTKLVESLKKNRLSIMRKVESILNAHYNWKAPKNEDLSDTTASLYDSNGNLAAVVSLVEDCILVDLAKGITAKISMLKSDEEIESELTSDVDAANDLIAAREIAQLHEVVADDNSDSRDPIDASESYSDYLENLERKVAKLESLYINKYLKRVY